MYALGGRDPNLELDSPTSRDSTCGIATWNRSWSCQILRAALLSRDEIRRDDCGKGHNLWVNQPVVSLAAMLLLHQEALYAENLEKSGEESSQEKEVTPKGHFTVG